MLSEMHKISQQKCRNANFFSGEDSRAPRIKEREIGEMRVSSFSAYETNELKSNLCRQKCAKYHVQQCRSSIFVGKNSFFPGEDPRASLKVRERMGELQNVFALETNKLKN